jgi:hypothetical protein
MDEYFFWGVRNPSGAVGDSKPFDESADPYGEWIDEMEEMFDWYETTRIYFYESF